MAKYGLPSAPPLSFLTIRFAIAAALLLLVMPFLSVRWPGRSIDFVHAAVAGVLLQAVYLGGVFTAVSLGIGAALAALLVGLQPLMTVVLAKVFLSESITPRKLTGIALGLLGVCLVLYERSTDAGHLSITGLALCACALVGISVGTIYQKRYCSDLELLPSITVQYVASVALLFPLSLMFETTEIVWDGRFIFALTWLVLVLSIGAVFLLMWLIRQGEAGKVASLFYLVPPVVAIEAWILFSESITTLVFIGVTLCISGVAIVMKSN